MLAWLKVSRSFYIFCRMRLNINKDTSKTIQPQFVLLFLFASPIFTNIHFTVLIIMQSMQSAVCKSWEQTGVNSCFVIIETTIGFRKLTSDTLKVDISE